MMLQVRFSPIYNNANRPKSTQLLLAVHKCERASDLDPAFQCRFGRHTKGPSGERGQVCERTLTLNTLHYPFGRAPVTRLACADRCARTRPAARSKSTTLPSAPAVAATSALVSIAKMPPCHRPREHLRDAALP